MRTVLVCPGFTQHTRSDAITHLLHAYCRAQISYGGSLRINALLQFKHSFFQFRKACGNTTTKQLGQHQAN